MGVRRATGILTATLLVGAAIALSPSAANGASPSPPVCRPTHQLHCASPTDSGHTVHLRVGQRLTVTLVDPTLTFGSPRVVGRPLLRTTGTTAPGGLTVHYLAIRAGTTRLQSTGRPRCRRGEACPQFVVLWSLRVVVSPR